MAIYSKDFDNKRLEEFVRSIYRSQANTITLDADFVDGKGPTRPKSDINNDIDSSTTLTTYIDTPRIEMVDTAVDGIKFIKISPFVPKIKGLEPTAIEWAIDAGLTGNFTQKRKAIHEDDMRGAMPFVVGYTGLYISTIGAIKARYLSGHISSDWSNVINYDGSLLSDGNTLDTSEIEVKHVIDGLFIKPSVYLSGKENVSNTIEYYVTDYKYNVVISKRTTNPQSSIPNIFIRKEELEEGSYLLFWRRKVADGLYTIWQREFFNMPANITSSATLLTGESEIANSCGALLGDIYNNKLSYVFAGGVEYRSTTNTIFPYLVRSKIDQGRKAFINVKNIDTKTFNNDINVRYGGCFVNYLDEKGRLSNTYGDPAYGPPALLLGGYRRNMTGLSTHARSKAVNMTSIGSFVVTNICTGAACSNVFDWSYTYITNLPGTPYFVRLFGETMRADGFTSTNIGVSAFTSIFEVKYVAGTGWTYVSNPNTQKLKLLKHGLERHAGCLVSNTKVLITGGLETPETITLNDYYHLGPASLRERVLRPSDKTYLVEYKVSPFTDGSGNFYVDDVSIQQMADLPYRMYSHGMIHLGGTEVLLIGGEVADKGAATGTGDFSRVRLISDIIRFNYATGESKVVGSLRVPKSRFDAIPIVYSEDEPIVRRSYFGERPEAVLLIGGHTTYTQQNKILSEIIKWV